MVAFLGASAFGAAQDQNSSPEAKSALEAHYDAAQSFQSAGNLTEAAAEYKLFVADAVGGLAVRRAQAGDFSRAAPLFEEGLALAPDDTALKVQYAEACRAANRLHQAKSLAQEAVDSDPRNAAAHLVLGRVLSQLEDDQAAKQQFELAVDIQPDFVNGYALAASYLKLKDEEHAAGIFAEMLASFGDRPEVHLEFGTAYADAGDADRAVSEFKKAIQENRKMPGAHYSLGAAYMLGLGAAAYPQAAAEFEEELKISPDDYNSHLQLGVIELSQHKLPEAQADLTRAAALDPQNPDPLVSLCQVYDEAAKLPEAEAACRKAILLTKDVSRNHFQVERAYYLLARILMQTSRQDEAKKEMEVSNQLLRQSVLQNQGKGVAKPDNGTVGAGDAATPPSVNPEALKQAQAFEKRVTPAIADSYNNLGAIAAGGNDFASALEYFRKAGEWNPALPGLDYNWGRAAFSAHQYDQAVAPLGRYLREHPDDNGARSTLALTYFLLKEYKESLETFKPLEESQIDAVPTLAFVYAVALTKAGDYGSGLQKLKSLESANPGVPEIHKALGEALAAHGDYAAAVEEMRTTVRLNPADQNAQSDLNRYEAAEDKHSGTETVPKEN